MMDEKDSASDEQADTISSTPAETVFKPFSSLSSFGVFSSPGGMSLGASAALEMKASPHVTFAPDVLTGDRPASHDRKRNRRALQDDSAIDEIMGQITMKLTSLSTGDSARSQQDSICAFLEVLGCTESEASFYLDSSAWDIQTAVVLWLENNPHPSTSFAVRQHNPFGAGLMMADAPFTNPFVNSYKNREVPIPDLPADWKAYVSPIDGTIYFSQISTGLRQKHVPPGFADADSMADSETAKSVASLRRVILEIHDEEDEEDNNDALLQHALLDSENYGPRVGQEEAPQTSHSNSNSYYAHFPALDAVTAQTLAYAELPSPHLQLNQQQQQQQQQQFNGHEVSRDGSSAVDDDKMDQDQFNDI